MLVCPVMFITGRLYIEIPSQKNESLWYGVDMAYEAIVFEVSLIIRGWMGVECKESHSIAMCL